MNDNTVPKRIDRYDLIDKIGAGGMGLIYKAYDTKLKRSVAIKMISDRVKDNSVRKTIRERFFNEARAAGALSHPNLVQIYDFGETEDIVYIVMEYIEGETLEQLIKSKGPLNVDRLIRCTKEIAAGLSFAHKRGIVHRDVKPSNVIIEADSGISKILDFGIAKFVDEEEMKLTSTGMVLGSTHYLSPEHITGKNLDNRSDIFCLGTLLYEASTGTLPFRGNNSSTILYKIVHFDPPPVQHLRQELPDALSGVVSKCLQKRPDDRFSKCEDIIAAVEKFERSLAGRTSSIQSKSNQQMFTHSYFVRDSQLLNALVTQGKLEREVATKYRGQKVYDSLTRDGTLTEDDLAAVISDLLSLPWIPRGRLKTLRVDPSLRDLLPIESLKNYFFLPFFKDVSRGSLSVIIDGITDFQSVPEIQRLTKDYQLQLYVGSRSVIHQLIRSRLEERDSSRGTTTSTREDTGGTGLFNDKRILLIEPQEHFQQAIIKLFKGFEPALSIVQTLEEALEKVETSRFHHIWASRSIVGDELAFESTVIRTNPSCDLRFYDHLGEELFEDSIHYSKFRDFFARILQEFLKVGSREDRKLAQYFASLAARLAKNETENQRELDEVYFSSLFYKWEKLCPQELNLSELLFGIYRFRHIRSCITERFDGRGPMALRGKHIPLASRVIAALSVADNIKSDLKDFTEEELETLRSNFTRFAGKQLDPVLVAAFLEMIRPAEKAGPQRKVAIIDTDQDYSRQLQALLKNISLDATVYSDGVAALEGIRANRPDLIVSEVLLSKIDGFALAARIRANEILKDVPLVFVSKSERPEHSVKALQLGASDFISKSSEPEFIVAKIERLLK